MNNPTLRLVSSLVLLLATPLIMGQNTNSLRGSEYCSMKKRSSPVKNLFQPGSGPVHSFDVLKYTLDLKLYSCYVSPYPKSYTATDRILLRADSAIGQIKLDAVNSSLMVDSVGLAGVSFSHISDILLIQLDQQYNPGDSLEVIIYYKHKNVQDQAFYCKNGMVYTDCEPEGARKWFPCWDKPSDKAKIDLHAKVKSTVKLGSNGYLADSTLSGDTLTYHWISDEDVATYLMVLSSKVNYKLDIVYWHKLSNPADSVPMRFYYNSGENPNPVKTIIRGLTDWYSQKYTEHPFPKNGFASLNSEFPAGGMENQTLTSICPGCWYESLAAHEFAHQWFGDMITCSTWADIWLNEGFATWSEAFWYESYGGYAAYKAEIDQDATSYFNGNPGWPISDPQWAVETPSIDVLFNYAITYAKGACVLHQLRYVLGDSLFFQVLRSYCDDPSLKFRSATIGDFKDVVNSVAGSDYSWFFTEWIFNPNHPVYQNTYRFQSLGSNTWQVSLFLKQVQTNTVFYKMPVDVRIRFQNNTDTIVRIMNDVNNQQFSWQFSKQPVLLQFDPANQIVLKSGSTSEGVTEASGSAEGFTLGQNYPNPAGNSTVIDISGNENQFVRLEIRNLTGDLVAVPYEKILKPGTTSVSVDCSVLAPGVYFYTLTGIRGSVSRKMMVGR